MKILKLIFIFSMFSLVNCSADDTFSYNDYAFLEQTEWVTAFDLFEDGEVRFLRFEKNNALLQQEWWNGSFDIYSIIDQNSILRLGLDFEYKIKYRDNNKRLLLDCITDGNYFDVVDRIGEINSGNNILGKWADMNGTEFKFEYRELPNDDYVYLFYIKGVNAISLIDGSENPVGSWFLLKYEGNGFFTTDGAFDKDAFRLEIISENELRFIPEYESTGEYLRTKKIYAKGYDWVKDN